MIRAILIDDEVHSLDSLEIEIKEYCPDLLVVDKCEGAEEGIIAIRKLKPDLVFLDIEMPGMNGFELLKKVQDIAPDVIFTTAYDEYAIRAFKVSAMDYLLKPIDIEELQRAVQRVIDKKNSEMSVEKLDVLLTNINNPDKSFPKLAIPTLSGLNFIDVPEINYCMADGNYTTIFLQAGEKYVLSKPLKEVEELLNNPSFFRTHQTYLVNLAQIKEYVKGSGGQLILNDGTVVMVARARKEALMKVIYRR